MGRHAKPSDAAAHYPAADAITEVLPRVQLPPVVSAPILSHEPPLRRRTGMLIGLAAVGTLGLAGAAAVYLLAVPEHGSSTTIVLGQQSASLPATPTTVAPMPITATTTPPPTTTTLTTTAPTTTAEATTTTAARAAARTQPTATGRFSGTIEAKNGNTWTIANWDGTTSVIRVTSGTQLVPYSGVIPRLGPQFEPGQTVNIFWHSTGGVMVADTVYGSS